jgi:hypothetical protein
MVAPTPKRLALLMSLAGFGLSLGDVASAKTEPTNRLAPSATLDFGVGDDLSAGMPQVSPRLPTAALNLTLPEADRTLLPLSAEDRAAVALAMVMIAEPTLYSASLMMPAATLPAERWELGQATSEHSNAVLPETAKKVVRQKAESARAREREQEAPANVLAVPLPHAAAAVDLDPRIGSEVDRNLEFGPALDINLDLGAGLDLNLDLGPTLDLRLDTTVPLIEPVAVAHASAAARRASAWRSSERLARATAKLAARTGFAAEERSASRVALDLDAVERPIVRRPLNGDRVSVPDPEAQREPIILADLGGIDLSAAEPMTAPTVETTAVDVSLDAEPATAVANRDLAAPKAVAVPAPARPTPEIVVATPVERVLHTLQALLSSDDPLTDRFGVEKSELFVSSHADKARHLLATFCRRGEAGIDESSLIAIAPEVASHIDAPSPQRSRSALGAEVVAMAESKLDHVRGGFDSNGVQISFGIERAFYINGALVTTTSLNVSELSKMSAGQSPVASVSTAPGSLTLIQNGAGNSFVSGPISAANVGTVIQNTLDNQKIQSITSINASVNSLQLVRELNFQSSLRGVITDSLRR